MKFKSILAASFAMSCLFATAQVKGVQQTTEYDFTPHWYIQGAVGVQETLGETSFGKLIAPNAQLAAGYNFNSILGARLVLNSWQSKASIDVDNQTYRWKWNYIAPTVNATVDLTNLFGGYNPNRLVGVGIFAGIGVNIGYKNGEAADVNAVLSPLLNNYKALRLLWDGTKARFLGQFGANVDFRLSDHVKLGIELQANTLPDGYNSKKAGNADWYFNGLVGIKYAFGKTYTVQNKCDQVIEAYNQVPVVEERIVEKIVERPIEIIKEVQQPMKRDVFFTISNTKISVQEMQKVKEIAEYLKANPNAKVTITGYADKGTGSRAINLRLSNQRAQTVANTLMKQYGIASDRIVTESMGEAEHQPFAEPALNRVAICVAE